MAANQLAGNGQVFTKITIKSRIFAHLSLFSLSERAGVFSRSEGAELMRLPAWELKEGSTLASAIRTKVELGGDTFKCPPG